MPGRRPLAIAVVSCALVRGISACLGDDPSVVSSAPGERGQPCNQGRCLAGLSCIDGVCVGLDGAPAEEADAGAADATTEGAAPRPLTVFVTSTFHPANMGGLAGADALCTEIATGAGLEGEYVAILSTKAKSAKDRIEATRPIQLVDGTPVANDSAELFSGTLRARIDVDELGKRVPSGKVWTGTDYDGVADRSSSTMCEAWQNASAEGGAEYGSTDRLDFGWISISGDAGQAGTGCQGTLRLYCIGPK